MRLDLSRETELQEWLAKILEPICDAEPSILAEYIVALLKTDQQGQSTEQQLRGTLKQQLSDFIENGLEPFIDRLLLACKTQSYLPAHLRTTAATPTKPSTSTSALTPATSLSRSNVVVSMDTSSPGRTTPSGPRGRKRSRDPDDERHDSGPLKGPRLTNDARSRPRSPNGMDHDAPQTQGNGVNMGAMPMMSMSMGGFPVPGMNLGGAPGIGMGGMPVPQGQMGRPAGNSKICFDYFNKGHCKRGDQCKYSHGDNPIVANALPFLMNGFMNGMQPGMMIPPNLGNIMMGNGAFRPMGPGFPGRMNGRDMVHVDMTPGQTPNPNQMNDEQVAGESEDGAGGASPIIVDKELPVFVQDGVGSSYNLSGASGSRAMSGMSPYPNGSGNIGFETRPPRRHGGTNPSRHVGVTTVVVEKIPPANLSEGSVMEYFKQFGNITNIVVDKRTKQALITFSEHNEASAAVRSPDAPWGNKYAKVFFHNPIYGKASGAKVVAASGSESNPLSGTNSSSSQAVFNSPSKQIISVSATPTDPRQQLIEEQKQLLEEAKGASAERKREILKALRELNAKLEAAPMVPAPAQPIAPPIDPAAEALKKLDEDLDMHVAEASGTAPASAPVNSTREALEAHLKALRAEATSLGLDPNDPESESTPVTSSFRGYTPRGGRGARARGRGRGGSNRSWRGGAPPRGSMKLDLRPKKLLVKGVVTSDEDDKLKAVKEWYASTNQVENFVVSGSDGSDLIVEFKTRFGAEQALAKGNQIPGIGIAQIAWFVDPASSAPVAPGERTADVAENSEGSEGADPDAVAGW